MVISKCVPLEISRKRFSDFYSQTTPQGVYFVGYRVDEDGENKKKNKNVQIKYEDIEFQILQTIKADPEWGQGGSGGGTDPSPVVYEERNPAFEVAPGIEFQFDEDGEPIVDENGNQVYEITKSQYWNAIEQSTVIDLKNKKGFVEINGGGAYVEEFILFQNYVEGNVTHVVVDNTGLPIYDDKHEEPVEDFVLYYGSETNFIEIFRVPPMCRGVVQVLHTRESDLILFSSYTIIEDKTKFIRDIDDNDLQTNEPIDMTPDGDNDGSKFYVDMEQHKGYIDFPTGDRTECTFMFRNPEIGSNTYIVVNNTGVNYHGYPVKISYGKILDDGDESTIDQEDIEEITYVEDEKCIIEVFHSLSADIIVKITKV